MFSEIQDKRRFWGTNLKFDSRSESYRSILAIIHFMMLNSQRLRLYKYRLFLVSEPCNPLSWWTKNPKENNRNMYSKNHKRLLYLIFWNVYMCSNKHVFTELWTYCLDGRTVWIMGLKFCPFNLINRILCLSTFK